MGTTHQKTTWSTTRTPLPPRCRQFRPSAGHLAPPPLVPPGCSSRSARHPSTAPPSGPPPAPLVPALLEPAPPWFCTHCDAPVMPPCNAGETKFGLLIKARHLVGLLGLLRGSLASSLAMCNCMY